MFQQFDNASQHGPGTCASKKSCWMTTSVAFPSACYMMTNVLSQQGFMENSKAPAQQANAACIACRLSRQSYLGVIHYTLLLMLFGAAAFKAVHTPLLTAMLLSELASLLCLAGKMQASLSFLQLSSPDPPYG